MEQENFPMGKERKELLKLNQEKIADFQEKGPENAKKKYSWLDSPLDNGNKWSPEVSMARSFKEVMPANVTSLRNYIRETLNERKGKAIGIEFGGPGRQLFSDIGPNFFKKSFGITLVDIEKKQRTHLDDVTNHTVIEEDMLSGKFYEELEKLLNGEKVDLILERLGSGMEFIPAEPYTLSRILNKWYSILRENGIMLIKVPVSFNTLLDKWGKMITDEYSNVLEFQFTSIGKDNGYPRPTSAIRLRKLKGAPEKLPLLDPRAVSEIKKNIKNDWY